MKKILLLKTFLIWFLFIPIAIINGYIRNEVYASLTGDLLAHQLSTLLAMVEFILLSYFILRNNIEQITTQLAIIIGLIWVTSTILFEFGFGHFIIGHSWDLLFSDYNIFTGRVWSLFLVFELLTPLLLKKLITKK